MDYRSVCIIATIVIVKQIGPKVCIQYLFAGTKKDFIGA